jgi:FdhD protein
MKDLFRSTGIHHMTRTGPSIETDDLAIETILTLSDASGQIVSLLGTPSDLVALFVGHCACEGLFVPEPTAITVHMDEQRGYRVHSDSDGNQPRDAAHPHRLVTSSCGACDAPGLESLIDQLPVYLGTHTPLSLESMNGWFAEMKTKQIGFENTGGMHAAALHGGRHGLAHVAEDIGRHNAVDKAVGMALIDGTLADHSILLLSGRCGWDIVAKAARAGIGTIVSVGACSTLAADTARALNMRIFSFLKPNRCVAIGNMTAQVKDNP